MRALFLCAFLASSCAYANVYEIMLGAIRQNDLVTLEEYAADKTISYRATLESWSLLHEAAYCNKVQAARILLAHGHNVNARDGNGWTPLHVSVQKDHVEFSDFIVSQGACGLIADASKKTVIDFVNLTNVRMLGVVLRSLLNKEPNED